MVGVGGVGEKRGQILGRNGAGFKILSKSKK